MKLLIERNKEQKSPKQTIGKLSVIDKSGKVIFTCHTLELPWKNNQKQVSCIPPAMYCVKKRHSAKYGNHFHILNVPNREYILIHQGNYYTQILGCVLVGSALADINKDGIADVTNSVATMKKLNELLPNDFQVEIIQK